MTGAIPAYSAWRRLSNTRLRDVLRGRLDASLDWQQYIERAELPAEIADAVRDIVRRTHLWRSEKALIAAELLAHFQDGLAAGRSADDLLQTFGDRVVSARLMRRAKKRGRPLMWRAIYLGGIAVIVLMAVYAGLGFWMSTSRPNVKTDYLALINKSESATPEQDRAWPRYREAMLAIGPATLRQDSTATNLPAFDAELNRDQLETTEKFLNGHTAAIAKLREAARQPKLGFVASISRAGFSAEDQKLFGFDVKPEEIEAAKHETVQNRWLISTLLPHLQLLRSSASLLALDARRAATAGDGKTALDDITALYGLCRHCEEIPFILPLLVAEAAQRDARAATRQILSSQPKLWTDAQLRVLAHQMAANRINWQRGFEGERDAFYDIMQRVYTDNGHGDGRLALRVMEGQNLFQLIESVATGGAGNDSIFANKAMALITLPAANMAVAGRREMTDVYDRITDRAQARLATPYWEWAKEPPIDDEVRSLADGPIARYRYLFVLMLTPAYDTLLNRAINSDAERNGVLIGLALELYHRTRGKWPTSLGELSPEWLPSVPVDPITGQPLRYKVVNDRPLVYSVGIDRDDDGGRVPKDRLGEFRAENATPHNPQTTESDGDWVLWSTSPQK